MNRSYSDLFNRWIIYEIVIELKYVLPFCYFRTYTLADLIVRSRLDTF